MGRQLQPFFSIWPLYGPKRTGAFGPERGGTKGTDAKWMRLDCRHTPLCYKKEWVCLHLFCAFGVVVFVLLSDICSLAVACGMQGICLEHAAKMALPFWLKLVDCGPSKFETHTP